MLVVADRRRAVPLAELLSIGSVNHRQVREARHRRAQRPVEHDLLRRVRDVIVAAHNERDAHRDVVGDDRHVVDRRSVRAQDDEVFDVLVRKGDRIVHEIVPRRRPLGNAKAQHVRLAGGNAPRRLLWREAVAPPVVCKRLAPRFRVTASLIQLSRRAEAAIRGSALQQRARVRLMPRQIGALIDDLLVPEKAEPLEPLEDPARAFVGAARPIGILDAKQELTAVMLHEEPVDECRARHADVQVARGRRGKPEAVTIDAINHQ